MEGRGANNGANPSNRTIQAYARKNWIVFLRRSKKSRFEITLDSDIGELFKMARTFNSTCLDF